MGMDSKLPPRGLTSVLLRSPATGFPSTRGWKEGGQSGDCTGLGVQGLCQPCKTVPGLLALGAGG